MTAPRRNGRVLPFATNVARQWSRLRRRRPVQASALRARLFVVGLIVTIVGIAFAAIFLDAASVEWAKGVGPEWHRFFQTLTQFGKSEWWLVPSGIPFLLLLCGDWRKPDPAASRAWAEVGALLAFFFFAVAASGLTTDLVKLIVGRARPALFGEAGHLAFSPFRSGYLHFSFPSGHSTTVVAATTAIALVLPRAGVVVGILAVLICISRVGVGAHYPSDLVGGAFIGATVTVLLAMGWSQAGVGFRRDEAGRLVPFTSAIRRLYQRGGVGAFAAGLRRAFLG